MRFNKSRRDCRAKPVFYRAGVSHVAFRTIPAVRPLKNQRQCGAVSNSSCASHWIACGLELPHISADACKPEQQAGRSG